MRIAYFFIMLFYFLNLISCASLKQIDEVLTQRAKNQMEQ